MTIPIIIFHLGNQEYVHLCLKQAKKYNNNIHILTDNENNFIYENIKCINYIKYNNYMKKFQYIYKHFSSNSQQLEFICIVRWMCIYEYMKEQSIEKAFICDSDVLLYDNISNIVKKYFKDDLYLCTSSSKNVTGGQSIFTLNKLEQFVNFCFNFYNTQVPNIIQWYKTYNEPGGICDMTLLYYFCNGATEFVGLRLPEYPYYKNDLTNIIDNKYTFDLHLSTFGNHLYHDEYEKNENTQNKNIFFKEEKPFCYNKRLDKDIQFYLLHFQGKNKRIMKDYYNMTSKVE